jgi:hypothetical protein
MDLLSYSLADLIPFSRETYFRLFERYNIGVWPAPIVGLAWGFISLFAVRRPEDWGRRAAVLMIAACWLWVGWAFQVGWYAPLSWTGIYFGIGFGLQGVLMAAMIRRIRPVPSTAPSIAEVPWDRRVALVILLFALLVQPLLGLFSGRPWYGLEVFGSAPDPTVLATLGMLLMIRHPLRWLLSIIPLIWCLISGATLFVLSVPVWPVMPFAAAVYLGIAGWQWGSERRRSDEAA